MARSTPKLQIQRLTHPTRGGTKQPDELVVCPPMFAHDVDRIEENLQGDGFIALEIRVEIAKRNV